MPESVTVTLGLSHASLPGGTRTLRPYRRGHQSFGTSRQFRLVWACQANGWQTTRRPARGRLVLGSTGEHSSCWPLRGCRKADYCNRPVLLSITHNSRRELDPEDDVGQACEPAP